MKFDVSTWTDIMQADTILTLSPLQPGDQVLTKIHRLQRTKIDYPYSGPFEVVKRLENDEQSGNV